jgi:hypothetical protein
MIARILSFIRLIRFSIEHFTTMFLTSKAVFFYSPRLRSASGRIILPPVQVCSNLLGIG